jgi:hypothetical protein
MSAPAGQSAARGKGLKSVTDRSLARDWRRWSAAERIAGVDLTFAVIAVTVVGGAGGSLH